MTSYPLALRQRMKALANCRGVSGFVSPPIGEALAVDLLQRDFGAHVSLMPSLGRGCSAEILREIALQVLLAHVLVRAD